jgi:hypothetical protein
MQNRSPRTLLAMSAAVALTLTALAPSAAFAKGPGQGADQCDGDCANDQPQAQEQVRTRDGSGDQPQARTRARDASAQQAEVAAAAGGGQQVQARVGKDQARGNGNGNTQARGNRNAAQNRGGKAGAGRGPSDDTPRGPEGCDECDIEMGELSTADIEGLLYMANEEKLAHDAYMEFAAMYDLPVFERIANSETRHQVAIRTVLERYGIEDTTAPLAAGDYSPELLDGLYADFVAQGSLSLEDALAAAILIEQVDIDDLKAKMAGIEKTAPDVFNMYSHLLTASGHHLAAFESQL